MKMFVNDLTVIDCSILDAEAGLLGESWMVDLLLEGELNGQSMVLDFAQVKKQIKHFIDLWVDHRLLVPTEHADIDYQQGEQSWVRNKHSEHAKCFVKGPEQGFCFMATEQITPQAVAEYLQQRLLAQLPSNIDALTLTLRNERSDEPYYQYSHGLKKHAGNCQRIAHGHRSRIHIYLDGKLNVNLQQQWAKRWQGIYLLSAEDQIELCQLDVQAQPILSHDCIASQYHSQQGVFELALPQHRVERLSTDTTIECLADYIAAELSKVYIGSKIEVHAFEGIGKGAISTKC